MIDPARHADLQAQRLADAKCVLRQALVGVPMVEGMAWIEDVLTDWAAIDPEPVRAMALRLLDHTRGDRT